MARTGRPRKSADGELRNQPLQVKGTASEVESVRKRAEELGMTVSELVFSAAIQWIPPDVPSLELPVRLQHLAERGAVKPSDTLRQKLP